MNLLECNSLQCSIKSLTCRIDFELNPSSSTGTNTNARKVAKYHIIELKKDRRVVVKKGFVPNK